MTGYLNENDDNPMSVLTVGAFEDMGYGVSYATATADPLVQSPCCRSQTSRHLRGGRGSRAGEERELRPKENDSGYRGSRRKSRPVSKRMHERAANEAAKELKALRDSAPSASFSDGLSYVGGNSVSILMIDDDGEMKEEKFEWHEVNHRL